MNMQNGALIIGNTNVDIVMGSLSRWPEMGTETMLTHSDFRAGGSAGNTVLVLRSLDQPTCLISAFGNDELGRWLAGKFEEDLAYCAVIDAPTCYSVGLLHSNAERTFFSNVGHLDALSYHHVSSAIGKCGFASGLVLLSGAFTTPTLRNDYTKMIKELKSSGWQIAIDPGWPAEGWTPKVIKEVEQWFSLCDHVLINDKEAMALAGTEELGSALPYLEKMVSRDALLVVKCGADGAMASKAHDMFMARAPKVEAFDTVGAGDAFNAGYIASVLDNSSIQKALDLGVATASRHISQFPRNFAGTRSKTA